MSCSFTPQHAFLEPHRVHVRGDERDVGADGADVRDVIVDAFQFEADRAQRASARRRLRRQPPVRRRGRTRCACAKLESPEMLSASRTPCATGRFSKSFSVPLCV